VTLPSGPVVPVCPEAIGKEVGHGRDQTQEMDELPKEVTFGVFGFFI
jgi:hypothetical protein